MNLINILSINLGKLKNRTGKALFLIVPIMLLVALSVIVSSQSVNFQKAANQSIIGTAQQQNTVIEVKMDIDISDPRAIFEASTQNFTETDLQTISSIHHVESAQLANSLPIDNATISELFSDVEVAVTNIIGLNPEMAALYTAEDFSYQENQPIPVILNASTFINQYEDWEDQNEVTIQISRGLVSQTNSNQAQNEIENLSPIKSEAINYIEEDLLGKQIQLNVLGLSDLQGYEVKRGADGLVYTKLTSEEIKDLESNRQSNISTYWKYGQLNTPLTYNFVVVGVIESEDDSATYIPAEAADLIMHDYFQREIDARKKLVPEAKLNSIYNGISYDGNELKSDILSQITRNSRFGAQGSAVFRPGGGFGRPPELERVDVQFEDTASYNIPGLVVSIDPETDEVLKHETNADAYSNSAKSSQTILIKIDDVSNRDDVVADINRAGYSYQDFNSLQIFGSIDQTISRITIFLTIGFTIFTVGVIVLTMSKFVSDNRKEIGIFRAMGMTKGNVRMLFITQALLYTVVGYIAGLTLGLLINLGLAQSTFGWFENTINSTLGEGFEVVQKIDLSIFQQTHWESVLAFSGVLALITLLVSLIPASRAASISPVEAIKGE